MIWPSRSLSVCSSVAAYRTAVAERGPAAYPTENAGPPLDRQDDHCASAASWRRVGPPFRTDTEQTQDGSVSDSSAARPEYWHKRAAELRQIAEVVQDADVKRQLLDMVESYERLAKRAEERVRLAGKKPDSKT